MQTANLANKGFLENYHNVLSHHIDCILKSRMLLDEDMHLIMTFWDPSLFTEESSLSRFVLTSATYATVGVLVSIKLRNLCPFTISLTPAIVQIAQQMTIYYFERKYKRNFESFINLLCELYELSHNIIDYYHKRDMAVQICKLPNEAYILLLRPGEEFLKNTTLIIVTVLEELRSSMLRICKLVPVSEGEYISSLEWNLEDFKRLDYDDFKELQHRFQKLSDFYVLIVSNYLSCLGLSFCVQLWKEHCCNFENIFNDEIPELYHSLQESVNKIKTRFKHIRFTLQQEDETPKMQRNTCKSINNVVQLQRPLADFLANVQVTFETAKQLQLLLDEYDSHAEFQNLTPLVEDISNQLVICDDSLNTFVRLFCLLSKRSVAKKIESVPSTAASVETTRVGTEIHYDDPLVLLEDEEYNLSIHGSEDEDCMPVVYDFTDQCSTEHLELMLHELKKKLKERKGGQKVVQDDQNKLLPVCERGLSNVDSSLEGVKNSEPIKSSTVQQLVPPLPPPLPFLCPTVENQNNILQVPDPSAIHRLPPLDNSDLSFLDAVKTVALKLNRDEEVFGSEAVISSDSDES